SDRSPDTLSKAAHDAGLKDVSASPPSKPSSQKKIVRDKMAPNRPRRPPLFHNRSPPATTYPLAGRPDVRSSNSCRSDFPGEDGDKGEKENNRDTYPRRDRVRFGRPAMSG